MLKLGIICKAIIRKLNTIWKRAIKEEERKRNCNRIPVKKYLIGKMFRKHRKRKMSKSNNNKRAKGSAKTIHKHISHNSQTNKPQLMQNRKNRNKNYRNKKFQRLTWQKAERKLRNRKKWKSKSAQSLTYKTGHLTVKRKRVSTKWMSKTLSMKHSKQSKSNWRVQSESYMASNAMIDPFV
jgi:hypothetical protein